MKTSIQHLQAIVIIILSLGLGACASNQVSQVPQPSKEMLYRSADMALQNKDYANALGYYIRVLETEPGDPETLTHIARIHNTMGNYQLATFALNQALQTNPDYVPALSLSGLYAMKQKNNRLAATRLEKAVALDQARLSKVTGNTEGYYELDSVSPMTAYNALGVISDVAGKHDLARKLFALCLVRDNTSAVLLTNLGYSHYLAGEYNQAAHFFTQAIDFDPKFERAWANLGLIYARQGQYTKAFQALRRVMDEEQAYNDLGYFMKLDGRYQEAEYFLQKAIDNSPRYFEMAYANLEDLKLQLAQQTAAAEQKKH